MPTLRLFFRAVPDPDGGVSIPGGQIAFFALAQGQPLPSLFGLSGHPSVCPRTPSDWAFSRSGRLLPGLATPEPSVLGRPDKWFDHKANIRNKLATQTIYAPQESGFFAIPPVASNITKLHTPTNGVFQHLQRQGRFALITSEGLGNGRSLTAPGIVRPVFRQIQPGIDYTSRRALA